MISLIITNFTVLMARIMGSIFDFYDEDEIFLLSVSLIFFLYFVLVIKFINYERFVILTGI